MSKLKSKEGWNPVSWLTIRNFIELKILSRVALSLVIPFLRTYTFADVMLLVAEPWRCGRQSLPISDIDIFQFYQEQCLFCVGSRLSTVAFKSSPVRSYSPCTFCNCDQVLSLCLDSMLLDDNLSRLGQTSSKCMCMGKRNARLLHQALSIFVVFSDSHIFLLLSVFSALRSHLP